MCPLDLKPLLENARRPEIAIGIAAAGCLVICVCPTSSDNENAELVGHSPHRRLQLSRRLRYGRSTQHAICKIIYQPRISVTSDRSAKRLGQRHSEITGLGIRNFPNSVVPPYSAPYSSSEDHHVLLSRALSLLGLRYTRIPTNVSTHLRPAARLRSMAPAMEAVVARPATRKPQSPRLRSLPRRDQAHLRFCSWSTSFKLTTNRCLEKATL